MATTGELIRLMNYVEDITTTLRRITAFVPTLEPEERKRLGEVLRNAGTNLNDVLTQLDKK
jgi:hypothetical protein